MLGRQRRFIIITAVTGLLPPETKKTREGTLQRSHRWKTHLRTVPNFSLSLPLLWCNYTNALLNTVRVLEFLLNFSLMLVHSVIICNCSGLAQTAQFYVFFVLFCFVLDTIHSCAMHEKATATQRSEKKGFRLETAELLGNCTKGNCALEKWMREWVMLSFAHTNNWSALEQVIYPSIGALEIFGKEDCGFSGRIREICVRVLTGKNKRRERYSNNSDKKGVTIKIAVDQQQNGYQICCQLITEPTYCIGRKPYSNISKKDHPRYSDLLQHAPPPFSNFLFSILCYPVSVITSLSPLNGCGRSKSSHQVPPWYIPFHPCRATIR